MECKECGGSGELGLHKCEACQWSGTMKAGDPTTMKVGDVVRLPTAMAIYACGDCHFTETYLADKPFPKPLESYDGWERVSAPVDGPFR